MERKIAYKVVSKGHYSIRNCSYPKKYRKRYLLNKITKAPKNSMGIFIHKTLKEAIHKAKVRSSTENTITKVLRVEVLGDIYIPIRVGFVDDLEEFYKKYKIKYVRFWVNDFSSRLDTHLADVIKPIEVLHVFENGKETKKKGR